MAAISVVAASVKLIGTGKATRLQAAAAVTHGQVVYASGSGKYTAAISTSEAAAAATHIAITPQDTADDYFYAVKDGAVIALGVTGTIGDSFFVDDAVAGSHVPIADIGGGNYKTLTLVCVGADKYRVVLHATGETV